MAAADAVKLLVIDTGRQRNDWYAEFRGARLADGRAVVVEQCGWHEMLVAAYTHTAERCVVHIAPSRMEPLPGSRQGSARTCLPDFVLVRNEPRGATDDHRNALLGLIHAGVPSLNSLESILAMCERPVVHGALHAVSRRLGDERFPLIPQNYFASHREMLYSLPFPAVVKVGHGHAGAGKMRVATHRGMDDVRSVLSMTTQYCTVEPFVRGEYDIRLQRIDGATRAFRRVSVSGNWKTNCGTSHIEEVEPAARHVAWLDAVGALFGGLDIFTVDAIRSADDGSERILEANGTSSGLAPHRFAEDCAQIGRLTLRRMNEALVAAAAAAEV